MITYVSLNEILLSVASQPTTRPARKNELAILVFCFYGFQKSQLNFTKHYIRTDLGLVLFHFEMGFVMVWGAFTAKSSRM